MLGNTSASDAAAIKGAYSKGATGVVKDTEPKAMDDITINLIFNAEAAVVESLAALQGMKGSTVAPDKPERLKDGGVRIKTNIPFLGYYNGAGDKVVLNMYVTIDKEGIYVPLDARRFSTKEDRHFLAPLGNQHKTKKAARILGQYAAKGKLIP